MSDLWVFYIIANRGATYAGVSPDPERRLRKHNGELSGGEIYEEQGSWVETRVFGVWISN